MEEVVSSPKPKGLSTAGMVLSIVGLVLTFTPCLNWAGIAPLIIGIILSGVALKKVKAGEAEGGGMAKAGLICGIVGIGLWIYVIMVMGAAIGELGNILEGI
jgi:hypothetical protein|tara:strand:+ start:576 stop:881 length:306 start_codon:yes stop_codon:yes gene_type:complete